MTETIHDPGTAPGAAPGDASADASAAAGSIARQIESADQIGELAPAARRIDELVPLLHAHGVPVAQIAKAVCELNGRLFARLWALLAPPVLVHNSCLIVMGSEGRGEQVFKTDQDNALLLRDSGDAAALEPLADRFSATLIELGYPRCPGNIMVNNPLWRQPVAGFRQTLGSWIFGADPRGPMLLAIFLDAVAVAGDATLLQQARGFVQEHVVDNDAFFARFARAADQFVEPSNVWRRLRFWGAREEAPFELKKLGLFPIVHGVRALALQYRVDAVATDERLSALVAQRHVPAATAGPLLEALHLLMALKLENNLRQRAHGEAMANTLRLAELSAEQRAALDRAMLVVRAFRQFLRLHFKLDTL